MLTFLLCFLLLFLVLIPDFILLFILPFILVFIISFLMFDLISPFHLLLNIFLQWSGYSINSSQKCSRYALNTSNKSCLIPDSLPIQLSIIILPVLFFFFNPISRGPCHQPDQSLVPFCICAR
ncbi:hypothetical protein OIU79_027237 [Salix purpurea]|uniref:Uncharacterized protein n=1 Tax=Salix purpurea TaxID=77065 RepID=A0A9Q0VTP0_SALPP|nr:hypothetical protein OIU79_027237 [Salix purpurea]